MKRARIFWDLDETLLSTTELLRPILHRLGKMVRWRPEEIREQITDLDKTCFSWERLLERIEVPENRRTEAHAFCQAQYDRAGEYLFPGVREALEELDPFAEQILVTFGDPVFQRRKWVALAGIHSYFHSAHFVDGKTVGKGALMATYNSTGVRSFFVDDSDRWMADVLVHAPHVVRIKMRHGAALGRPEIVTLGPADQTEVSDHAQVVSLIRRLVG